MTTRKVKKKRAKKRSKTTDMARLKELVSNLQQLHKLEDVLLRRLSKCLLKKQ